MCGWAGYDVLGLRDEDAQAVFKRVKANYEGVGYEGGEGEGLEDLSQSLIVKRWGPPSIAHDLGASLMLVPRAQEGATA
jgi:hypothetical protein